MFKKLMEIQDQFNEELHSIYQKGTEALPQNIDIETYMFISNNMPTGRQIIERYKRDPNSSNFILMTPDQIYVNNLEKRVKELEQALLLNRPESAAATAMRQASTAAMMQ